MIDIAGTLFCVLGISFLVTFRVGVKMNSYLFLFLFISFLMGATFVVTGKVIEIIHNTETLESSRLFVFIILTSPSNIFPEFLDWRYHERASSLGL